MSTVILLMTKIMMSRSVGGDCRDGEAPVHHGATHTDGQRRRCYQVSFKMMMAMMMMMMRMMITLYRQRRRLYQVILKMMIMM